MPGKVNPVLPEATLMVCAQVIGNDAAVATAGAAGSFELNVMMPVIARNLLESIRLLSTSTRLLADRCVAGITANAERMRAVRRVLTVGGDAAEQATSATRTPPRSPSGRSPRSATIREVVLEHGVRRGRRRSPSEQLDERARRGEHDPPVT